MASTRPSRPTDPPVTPQLAFGIFAMLAGVVLMLDTLRIVDAVRAARFWPIGLLLLGAAVWVRKHNTQGRLWGGVWMLVGATLLLNTFGVVTVGFWELFWPLAMVAVGTTLVLKTLRQGATRRPASAAALNLFAMLGETKRTVESTPFDGAAMTALMGGCILDLRQAIVPPGAELTIDLFAILGGHEIRVPQAWKVVTDVSALPGNVSDDRMPPIVEAPAGPVSAAPRLIIRGVMFIGELQLKN